MDRRLKNAAAGRAVIAAVVIIAIIFTFAISLADAQQTTQLKPEIQHKFREPEKRPPILVTTFFTALVASPALLLFTLWPQTVTLKFETLTIRRAIFHVLFLLVLVCYAKFWLGTNMFDTMRYTAPLICALFYFYQASPGTRASLAEQTVASTTKSSNKSHDHSSSSNQNPLNALLTITADLKDPVHVYLLAVFLTGVIQFIYVILVGTFPFNSFLAGFLSCVTSFVLGINLKKTSEFKGFLFGHLVLHMAVLMLIG